jgi:hypothetical protein
MYRTRRDPSATAAPTAYNPTDGAAPPTTSTSAPGEAASCPATVR